MLFGDVTHRRVRERAAQWLAQHYNSLLDPTDVSSETFQEYLLQTETLAVEEKVAEMSLLNTWGDGLTLAVIARAFEVRILVYQSTGMYLHVI